MKIENSPASLRRARLPSRCRRGRHRSLARRRTQRLKRRPRSRERRTLSLLPLWRQQSSTPMAPNSKRKTESSSRPPRSSQRRRESMDSSSLDWKSSRKLWQCATATKGRETRRSATACSARAASESESLKLTAKSSSTPGLLARPTTLLLLSSSNEMMFVMLSRRPRRGAASRQRAWRCFLSRAQRKREREQALSGFFFLFSSVSLLHLAPDFSLSVFSSLVALSLFSFFPSARPSNNSLNHSSNSMADDKPAATTVR